MANTLKFGNGEWYGKKDTILAYNDLNSNYKPLPFNFSRGSTPSGSKATTINKDGLIETVGNNVPRIDYKDDSKGALLLEPSRTNNIIYSQDFSQEWHLSSATITSNSITSPEGLVNATTLDISAFGGGLQDSFSVPNGDVTFSLFVKKGTTNGVRLRIDAATDSNGFFDLVNNTVYSSTDDASIESYGNGWYKVSISANITSFSKVAIYGTNGLDSYQNGSVYIFGAQLEQGSYATSYIPTQGGVVTRITDELPLTELRSKNILGSSDFSYFLDLTHQGGGMFSGFFNEVNSSSSYKGGWVYDNGLKYRTLIGGSNFYTDVKVPILNGDRVKCCVTLNGSTRKIYANGVLLSTLNNCDNLSNSIDGFIQYYGNTQANYESFKYNGLRVYNTELTEAEAIALTQV